MRHITRRGKAPPGFQVTRAERSDALSEMRQRLPLPATNCALLGRSPASLASLGDAGEPADDTRSRTTPPARACCAPQRSTTDGERCPARGWARGESPEVRRTGLRGRERGRQQLGQRLVSVIDRHHVTATIGTLAYASFLAARTAGRWLGPAVLERFGRVTVLRTADAIATAGVVVFALGPSTGMAFAGTLLRGMGAALGLPISMSAGADEPARAAGRVSVPPRTEHGSELGTQHWVIERAFAHLHRFRRLRIRWEIRDDIHEAFLTLGCALICRRRLVAVQRRHS